MKFKILVYLLGAGLLVWSCSTETESVDSQDPLNPLYVQSTVKETVPIFDVVNGAEAGTSTLHRNANGITVNYKASGLTPGYAYTIWWVIWNNPGDCEDGCPDNCDGPCGESDFGMPDVVEVEVMYAGGHVVGNSGKGNFSAHLNENDADGTVNPAFGLNEYGGLHDAETAEVHVVLRSHGPAVPGIVNEQIGSYGGGCDNFFGFPPFTEVPDEIGECGDIYASVHVPPM